jgi:hypothetical protein
MRFAAIVVVCCLLLTSGARAWNETGHMTIARLAWLKLSPDERQQVTAILKEHPHYAEYLSSACPDGLSVDEWAFMRAAYWPDWIRSNYKDQYHQGPWHYVTAAFFPRASKLAAREVASPEPNVVTQITDSAEKIRKTAGTERAIAMCWLIHLVGDIHQPLHCATLFNEVFPDGDMGGNSSLVRIGDDPPIRLHAAWDGMLSRDPMMLPTILDLVAQLQALEKDLPEAPKNDLANHVTPAEWSREGFEAARRFAYLDGDLVTVNANPQPSDDLVPRVTSAYMDQASLVAKQCAIKAGQRLSDQITKSLR